MEALAEHLGLPPPRAALAAVLAMDPKTSAEFGRRCRLWPPPPEAPSPTEPGPVAAAPGLGAGAEPGGLGCCWRPPTLMPLPQLHQVWLAL